MEELIALIRETARISTTVSVDTPLISTGLVGSLQVAALLGAINAKYGVSLALDEIGADNFDTPVQILDLLQSRS